MSTGKVTAASGCSSSVVVTDSSASSEAAVGGFSPSLGCSAGVAGRGVLDCGAPAGGGLAGGVLAGGVPAGGAAGCCATEPAHHAASTTAGAANLNQRAVNGPWLRMACPSLQVARDPKSDVLARFEAGAARRQTQIRRRRAAPARAAHDVQASAFGPERVVDGLRRLEQIERVEILDPFGDVAAEIEDAVGVGRVAAGGCADRKTVVIREH